VLKDAGLLLQVQLEFEEQSTGGRGLSDVRGRTKQQDEGNYMWRFITHNPSHKRKDIMEDSTSVS